MLLDNFYLVVSGSILVFIVFARLIWLAVSPIRTNVFTNLLEQDKRSFFGQLDIAVRSHFMVLPSLPVGDVLKANRWSRAAVALNIKKNLRFDFVLYHRRKMEVCCVINLIPYNATPNSREFRLLRELCESANLPLLQYEMKPWRDVTQLRSTIFAACGLDDLTAPDYELPTPRTAIAKIEAETPPHCPKCQQPMKLVTLKKAPHVGTKCWVCTTYPACKGARIANIKKMMD